MGALYYCFSLMPVSMAYHINIQLIRVVFFQFNIYSVFCDIKFSFLYRLLVAIYQNFKFFFRPPYESRVR